MPLALVGLGLTAGGAAMSIAGNAKSQSAINAARSNEVAQQSAIQQKSNAIFQNSLAQSTPAVAAQQMAQGQNQRQSIWNTLQSASTPVASALPATGTTTATGKANARATTAGNALNTMNEAASAREGSYGDWENQQAIKNADAAQELGVQNNFSQGDAALLPTELSVASQAGDKLGAWGSIVSSLGQLAGVAGATGAFKTAAPGAVDANGVPIANNIAAHAEAGFSPVSQGVDDVGSAWNKIYS